MKGLAFLLTLFASASAVRADGPLRSIIVFGDEKTERATILDIVGVFPQTYINDRLVKDVDDRLVNSGLFKEVRVRKIDNPDGTADLRIIVAEKQLWFVFPVFQAWSGRYSGGGVFGESNLLVPSGSTLFLLEGGNKRYRGLAAFDVRNIYGSRFALRTWLSGKSDDTPLYNDSTVVDEINMKEVSFALKPGFQWTNDIRTSVIVNYRYVHYGDSPLVALSGTQGNDVSMEFEFLYDSLRRREAFLNGRMLRASYEVAESRFGSDFTYHIEEVEGRMAFHILRYFNYVVMLEGTIGDETLPFHRDLTLGGSSLRGFSERQFRGDTRIIGRQDLMFRIFHHSKFSVFGDVFYDLGLIYFDAQGMTRSSFRNGTGGGLRVSLSEILAPVFGMDFGYGIEDHAFHMYVALGLVEF